MSPQQKAQIAAKLAKVEAEQAKPLAYFVKQVSLAEFKAAYPRTYETRIYMDGAQAVCKPNALRGPQDA